MCIRDSSGTVVSFVDVTKVKEVQLTLAEKETTFKEIAQKTRLGAWHFIPATGELRWSDETFRIHEVAPGHQPRPEESIGFYLPEYRPIIAEAFRRACQAGVSYDPVSYTHLENHRQHGEGYDRG